MVNPRFLKKAKEWGSKEPPKEREVKEVRRETRVPLVKGSSFRDHKEFYGSNLAQMPLLVADGLVPMSVYDLVSKRTELLNTSNPDEGEFDYFMNKYFDTGDGVLYLPKSTGGIKIVPDSAHLRAMTPNSQLVSGALNLEGVDLSNVMGASFSKQDLERIITGRHLTLGQAKSHPIWLAVLRDDNGLLNDYAEAFFAHARKKHGYTENMVISLGSNQEVPTMRAWIVDRTGNRSIAGGYNVLDYVVGRLVGLASETQGGKS